MNIVKKVSFVLLIVGGLNWGLVGLFGYDLVAELLPSAIATLVYILVGASAVISIFAMKGCGTCEVEDEPVEDVAEEVVSSEHKDDSMSNNQM